MTENSVPAATGTGAKVPRQRRAKSSSQKSADLWRKQTADPTAEDAPSMAQMVSAQARRWSYFRSSEGRLMAEHEDHKGWAVPVSATGEWGREIALSVEQGTNCWPSSRDLSAAVDQATWMASRTSREVSMRAARTSQGNVVIDLGGEDREVVAVKAGGWATLLKVPAGALMRRGKLTGQMAAPLRGEGEHGLEALWDLVPVAEEDRPLVLALLLTVWLPDVASPVVLVTGRQDSGKTTAARYLLSLVDPVTTPRGGAMPASEQEWKARLNTSRAVLIDNVSGITAGQSDTLCKITTGGEAVTRALWTDDDAHVTALQGIVWMTSIDTGAIRSDLASRLVKLDMQSLSPASRRPLAALTEAQDEARHDIVTALVELLATVLEVWPTVDTSGLVHRCGDWNLLVRCIDLTLGTDGEGRLAEQAGSLSLDVLEADPVAQVLLSAITDARKGSPVASKVLGTLTPTDLHTALTAWAEGHGGQQRMPSWPKTPKVMTGHLARIAPDLARSGISISAPRKSHGRRVLDVVDLVEESEDLD